MPGRHPLLRVAACCFLLPAIVQAQVFNDPFATDRQVQLKPAFMLASRGEALPCGNLLPERPLAAVDVLDLAFCNNPQTVEMWSTARVQAAQLGLAEAAWLPSINAKGSATRVLLADRYDNQKTAALTLSWLAFDFGAREANIRNAQELMRAAAATQMAGFQNLFLSVIQAYYTAQASRAALESTQLAEKSAATSLAAAEARYRIGSGTPADRLQAQTALSQARLNRIRSEGEARNAQGTLATLMGMVPHSRFSLLDVPAEEPDMAFLEAIEQLMQVARSQRPDLVAAEAQVKAAQAGVELARAQGRPTITLSTGPTWQQTAGVGSHGGTLGVAVNVPIFSGFDTTYRVRAAEAQADLKTAQRDRLQQQVALDVWRAYQSVQTATQSLQTARDLVSSAEQSERVSLGRYQAGVGNILDVLSAQSALAAARLQKIQARLDWNTYRATLAQAMGALDYSLLNPAAGGKP